MIEILKCNTSITPYNGVYIKSEVQEKHVVHVNVSQCIPYTASWDRSECKSPGSSRTAWGTVSAAAW